MSYTAKQKNFIHRVFKQSYESLIAGLSEDESNDFHQILNELIVPVDAMDDLDRFIEPLTQEAIINDQAKLAQAITLMNLLTLSFNWKVFVNVLTREHFIGEVND